MTRAQKRKPQRRAPRAVPDISPAELLALIKRIERHDPATGAALRAEIHAAARRLDERTKGRGA